MITIEKMAKELITNAEDKYELLTNIWAIHDSLADSADEDNENECQMQAARATMLMLQDLAYRVEAAAEDLDYWVARGEKENK